MITVYNLLEVDENASQEEIEKAYRRLVMEYHKDPKLNEDENNAREMILNKLKIAYEILSDEEKRSRYDKDLAQKRAEELIQNVSVEQVAEEKVLEDTKTEPEQVTEQVKEKPKIQPVENKVVYEVKKEEQYEDVPEEAVLTDEEKKRLKKAAQKEFKNNLKRAQKAEEEYNKAYNEAYNDYLRKLGYTVKEPWTFKRVRNLIISLLVIILICVLIWNIPITRNLLIRIYEENIVIKSFVDIIVMIFDAIISTFKG